MSTLKYIFDLVGDLFSKIYNLFEGARDAKIVMIGLDAAGKTTMLYKLKLGEVVTTIPTIGFNVETVEYKNLNFTVFDIGGQERLRVLWRHYFDNVKSIIYIVDSSDLERINESKEELMRVLDNDTLRDASLLIFANKQDNPNALTVSELANRFDLHSIKNRKWFIQPAISTRGIGIYEGLDWLARTLKESN